MMRERNFSKNLMFKILKEIEKNTIRTIKHFMFFKNLYVGEKVLFYLYLINFQKNKKTYHLD